MGIAAAYRSDAVLRQWREDVPSLRFSDDVKGDPNADFVLDTSEDANGTSEQDIPVPGGGNHRISPDNGPLTRYVKLRIAHAPGMPETFNLPPRVSDPDMNHGTCVTHVQWCMPGLLTSAFLWSRLRGKRSRHSRFMHNPQFCVSGKRLVWSSYSISHLPVSSKVLDYSTGVQIVSCTLSDDSVLPESTGLFNPILCVSQWNSFDKKISQSDCVFQIRLGMEENDSPLHLVSSTGFLKV